MTPSTGVGRWRRGGLACSLGSGFRYSTKPNLSDSHNISPLTFRRW